MKKRHIIVIASIISVIMSGCSPNTKSKLEIPEVKYTEIGHAVKNEVLKDGTVRTTYALVGLNEDKIKYLYLDQTEQDPQKDRHLSTNKELQTAYGLAYESDHGEWNEQINALQNYIVGNNMEISEVKKIPTYEKDDENKKVPVSDSDLGAACEIDIEDFLEVIEEACANTTEIEATRMGVGESIRINREDNCVETTIVFLATDYRYKISYAYMDRYSTHGQQGTHVQSMRERKNENDEIRVWVEQLENYEEYIYGLNSVEAYGIQTYDKGDGINTEVPKINTDLGKICDIDLSEFIVVLKEAAGRL